MKLGFCGNGGMNRAIQTIARERGHEITDIVKRDDVFKFENSDVVFEATDPTAAIENFEKLATSRKDFVIATTGWYENLPKVQKTIETAGVRVIWSSNFSIGVNLYFKIIESAAKLFNKADDFDIWATEIHHKNKADSPSGTAKTIEDILLQNISRKTAIIEEKLDRKIEPHEIHFSSTRGGVSNFGHTVVFDAAADFVKIEHFARNRDGYALGAIRAAEWLQTKKPGFYSMDDFLMEVFFAKNVKKS